MDEVKHDVKAAAGNAAENVKDAAHSAKAAASDAVDAAGQKVANFSISIHDVYPVNQSSDRSLNLSTEEKCELKDAECFFLFMPVLFLDIFLPILSICSCILLCYDRTFFLSLQVDEVKKDVQAAAHTAAENVKDAAHSAKAAASDAVDAAGQKAAEVKAKASDSVEALKDSAVAAKDAAAQKVIDWNAQGSIFRLIAWLLYKLFICVSVSLIDWLIDWCAYHWPDFFIFQSTARSVWVFMLNEFDFLRHQNSRMARRKSLTT